MALLWEESQARGVRCQAFVLSIPVNRNTLGLHPQGDEICSVASSPPCLGQGFPASNALVGSRASSNPDAAPLLGHCQGPGHLAVMNLLALVARVGLAASGLSTPVKLSAGCSCLLLTAAVMAHSRLQNSEIFPKNVECLVSFQTYF